MSEVPQYLTKSDKSNQLQKLINEALYIISNGREYEELFRIWGKIIARGNFTKNYSRTIIITFLRNKNV
ncbi:MAG: hypothetical protein F6K22_14885 [Okeania sp. SIO2F4]|uniref:hypothetical protein n=1 Tax=Okeania sp. SIO2F4 TaxID=2607790 RepID=UPI001429F041|nr:hypothetical protein [Okeania sp. SIO2F4]NES04008.1 hypothetical protein [Okeania sp. SIO2F4]